METDVRKNPGLLKLDLYCRGARIDDSDAVEEHGGRKILRTRAGLGSGLEVILPGGLWTNVPVVESFAQASPYVFRWRGDALWLDHDAVGPVSAVQLSPQPAWYNRKTTSGKRMTMVGTLQGTYLGVYPSKVCEYWLKQPDKEQCRFCSVGLNLGADDGDSKSIEEVVEVVQAARAESGITYVDFNTGHYDGDTYLDILEPYIQRVKEATKVMVGVQTPPHHDLARYRELRRMGVNRVSFCFEIWNRDRFAAVCPGKHREYGLDRYLEAIRYCAQEVGTTGRGFEPWVVNGEIIAGLEPPEDSIRAIDWIASVGAIPTVCVFRPLQATDFADVPPPKTEELVPVFRRLYEACMTNGLPIGVADNVHVSLVMLPEEARWLQHDPRRFWAGELKLKLMRKVFAAQLRRELKRGDSFRNSEVRATA
ncbi:MAG TPA: radical SAM protein [Candidatus Polarisedimenticolaceae bacterium]|nr:radical SAM protein [Candidatus Polarisedimenticolaceae bacterium]